MKYRESSKYHIKYIVFTCLYKFIVVTSTSTLKHNCSVQCLT